MKILIGVGAIALFAAGLFIPVRSAVPQATPREEARIGRCLPQARAIYGKRDYEAWSMFWRKDGEDIGAVGGFKTSAEEAAAYRVLTESQDNGL